jgi:hypothetical protein
MIYSGFFVRSITPKVDYCHSDGGIDHPEQLKPIEEGNANKIGL